MFEPLKDPELFAQVTVDCVSRHSKRRPRFRASECSRPGWWRFPAGLTVANPLLRFLGMDRILSPKKPRLSEGNRGSSGLRKPAFVRYGAGVGFLIVVQAVAVRVPSLTSQKAADCRLIVSLSASSLP